LVALAAAFLASFRDRAALQLEILALRHQLSVLQRSVKRPKLTAADRFLWAWLSAVWEDWQPRSVIMKPATVIGWHRKGFRLFWTWKIRLGKLGRPAVPVDVRTLIRAMSRDNPLWGAPRIHGELLKLGIAVGETSVSKYMVRLRKPPSQTWRTFLENHVKTMVSVDFFTVPTIRFQVLYVFLVLAHDRRRILHFAVTAHPTAEWTAQQLREAFPWDTAPRYLLRDRDRIFGKDFVDQSKPWGSTRCCRHRGLPGNELMSNGSSAPFAASAWTTSSCSANGACTVTCKVSWTTIIGAGRTWDWRRTLRFLARSNRRTWGGLLRCRKSADSIIVTRAAPHKGIFGAIPSALICALARPY
jgi:hypothetical protein